MLVAMMMAISGCPSERDSPTPDRAPTAAESEPVPEQLSTRPEPVSEVVPVVAPVDGLISKRGLPQHVSFSLANAASQPVHVVLTGLDHGSSERTALNVGEIQWWPEAAVEPQHLALAEPLELAAGEVGQLTVYLGVWPRAAIEAGQVDAMADSYRLIGKFTVDGVANDVVVVVRRSERTR